jgi:hypothetical protein
MVKFIVLGPMINGRKSRIILVVAKAKAAQAFIAAI